MMAFHREKNALTREKRSDALSHYHGTLTSLLTDISGEEIPQRVRTFTQTTYDDILAALGVLRGIHDAAIVIHGAVGCAAAAVALAETDGARWYSVNLNEHDSIFGSEAPLRETIWRAVKEGAAVVFIIGTPVVAINNDDVHAVLLELAEEIATPLLYVNTDGFRSKSPLTGCDIAFHALLQLVETPRERGDFINLLAVRENLDSIDSVITLLAALEIEWNLLPRLSSLATIRKAAQAHATVSLNGEESEYFGLSLEADFAVPYLPMFAPIGLSAIRSFLTTLGKIFGREDKADACIRAHEEALRDVLATQPLAGKRVFLQVDAGQVEGFIALVRELGGEIAGLALRSVDLNNRAILARLEAAGETPVIVAAGQPFEIANALAKMSVDYYIGQEQVAFVARYNVRPVSLRNVACYGYAGVRAFAEAVSAPAPDFRERVREAYSKGWLKKNGAWHVKREVR
jgi:nitrogenase molybdenum-iron protein alpha chain